MGLFFHFLAILLKIMFLSGFLRYFITFVKHFSAFLIWNTENYCNLPNKYNLQKSEPFSVNFEVCPSTYECVMYIFKIKPFEKLMS